MKANALVRNLGYVFVVFLLATLYAGLVGLIAKATMGYLVAWPIWILIFWVLFYRFGLLRYSGFIAVLPLTFLGFEIIRSIRSPGMNAATHRSFDRSHYTPGLRVSKPNLGDPGEGPVQIFIGNDGFRADPGSEKGNPARCRFVLIGDSMIYGTGLDYRFTLGPVLNNLGVPACVFGVTGNSPLDYLSTFKFVGNRIEPNAHIAFYIYAGNDFVGANLFVERKVLALANSLHKFFEWSYYFDQWRQASWTYSLFRRETRPREKKTWRYEIAKGQTLTMTSDRDPAQYVGPKSLSAPQAASFEYFLNRLRESVQDQPWRTSVLILPLDAEIYANMIRHSSAFVDLDGRRTEALAMCKGFSLHCEDLSRYIYRRSLSAGANPFLENDTHFSSFGMRVIAEHFVALTRGGASVDEP